VGGVRDKGREGSGGGSGVIGAASDEGCRCEEGGVHERLQEGRDGS